MFLVTCGYLVLTFQLFSVLFGTFHYFLVFSFMSSQYHDDICSFSAGKNKCSTTNNYNINKCIFTFLSHKANINQKRGGVLNRVVALIRMNMVLLSPRREGYSNGPVRPSFCHSVIPSVVLYVISLWKHFKPSR